MASIILDPTNTFPPTRDATHVPASLPPAKEVKVHPSLPSTTSSSSNPDTDFSASTGSLLFVGTATTILSYAGLRILTDPNFLHAGDHVHLGPGVTSKRVTNPAIELSQLPHIDAVLLSHYHADHFDLEVEERLRRDLPIITTPHARECLVDKKQEGEKFERVYALDKWESLRLDSSPESIPGADQEDDLKPAIKVTATPGKHVPPGPLDIANDLLGAVPPTNGWIVELGSVKLSKFETMSEFTNGYRIYISGDTLMVDELKEIPERYTAAGEGIDLMLVHLGGTTIPGPSMPLLMVTMDAKQGVELIKLVNPDVTIPIHYDDYDVFLSPLSDFKKAVEEAGLSEKVVYLDRKDRYNFDIAAGKQKS